MNPIKLKGMASSNVKEIEHYVLLDTISIGGSLVMDSLAMVWYGSLAMAWYGSLAMV